MCCDQLFVKLCLIVSCCWFMCVAWLYYGSLACLAFLCVCFIGGWGVCLCSFLSSYGLHRFVWVCLFVGVCVVVLLVLMLFFVVCFEELFVYCWFVVVCCLFDLMIVSFLLVCFV